MERRGILDGVLGKDLAEAEAQKAKLAEALKPLFS